MVFVCVSGMCMYPLIFTWEEIAGFGRMVESVFKRRVEESDTPLPSPSSKNSFIFLDSCVLMCSREAGSEAQQ